MINVSMISSLYDVSSSNRIFNNFFIGVNDIGITYIIFLSYLLIPTMTFRIDHIVPTLLVYFSNAVR